MEEAKAVKENPLDIDSSSFSPDVYLDCLLKCATLKQVMDKEAEIVTQSQFLQSEMQTLVYENYNKFISATETVRKMRSDFKIMQEEMNKLSENINKITTFSSQISENLQGSGNNVRRLCGTRQLLDKLQFLFLLPSQLNKAIAEGRYSDAVQDYSHAQRVLQKYGNQPSFQSIQTECSEIIFELKKTLRERLISPNTSATELAESVALLRQLQESDSSLQDIFLSCAESRLDKHLQMLSSIAEHTDILDWVEKCNNTLLADLAIIISCYNEMFEQEAIIPEFADKIMIQIFHLFEEVIKRPENNGTEMLIRGLDKFFRKLQAMTEISSSDMMSSKGTEVVIQCINHKAMVQYQSIQTQFKDSLMKVRQSLASKGSETIDLKDILNSLQVYLMQKIQASLLDLMAFLQNNLSFGLKPWCAKAVADACSKVINETMANLSDLVKKMACLQTSNNNIPFELLLILAKLCLDMQETGVSTLQNHLLKLLEEAAPGLTVDNKDTSSVMVHLSTAAQTALDSEVVFIGQTAAQMLRVSVLARDWLRAPEPRGPRAVCRRVVETLASADGAASQLFPTSIKPSSDSSRRTIWSHAPSSFSPLNRIFSERIEVFSPAGADRAALSNGALKVALKALVECVRLRTFGRHGLQQLQVDVHFLQQRLSCMGNDERLLNALLEDALASAQLRCVDPQLMEPSIVDIICERG